MRLVLLPDAWYLQRGWTGCQSRALLLDLLSA